MFYIFVNEHIDTFPSWKPATSKTEQENKAKVEVNTRRNMIINMNKQRHGLIYAVPGFSRVSGIKVASTAVYGSQEPANNGSDTPLIPAQAECVTNSSRFRFVLFRGPF